VSDCEDDDAAVVLVVDEVVDDVLDVDDDGLEVLDVASDVEPSGADQAVAAVVAGAAVDAVVVDGGVVVVLVFVVVDPSVADWRATARPVPRPRKTATLETAVASRARRAGWRRRGRTAGGSR
jgi:hypothetical protein